MLKKIWFQIHWFLGITAGTLLMAIGTSGALLGFQDEVMDSLNPGVITVAVREQAVLTPAQLVDRLKQEAPGRQVATVILLAAPGHSARIGFVPTPDGSREIRYADPYTGALLPPVRGMKFFDFVENLHRWLLLPKNVGALVAGGLAACLMTLALSGLYMRWPKRASDWRRWLKLDFALTGRPFLWNLHAVLGTWVLLTYLISTTSGMYWTLGWVETGIDTVIGNVRPARPAPPPGPAKRPRAEPSAPPVLDLTRPWEVFLEESGGYSYVFLRLPARPNQPIVFQYLDVDPPHERARNRMDIMADGAVRRNERFADKPRAARFVEAFRPLHTGTYWGLPGRIAMALSGLCLPIFAISGWMLYLKRRRTNRELRAARRALIAPPGTALSPAGGMPMLLVFATQSGRAERIALGAMRLLQTSGVVVKAISMARLDMAQLAGYKRALFVVSTFGEGDPPDVARRFTLQLARGSSDALAHMSYGVMALGDSQYASFCGFGRTLDRELRSRGGSPMFPVLEMDKEDPLALEQWHRHLESLGATRQGEPDSATLTARDLPYQTWQLRTRRQLNPGSQGTPLYHIELGMADGAMPEWQAGALVEILSPQAAQPRRYSIASIPQDGRLHLVVRQMVLATGGLGLASGWLTASAAADAPVQVRLIDNPGFAPPRDDKPCIYIGNGSGIAGLRSHLRERVRRGHRRNWLLFGERNAAADTLYEAEFSLWRDQGFLPELDRVFSRDSAEHPYVQDCLRSRAGLLQQWLAEGAVIYVCGSLHGMAEGVDEALGELVGEAGLAELIADGRYRRDVY